MLPAAAWAAPQIISQTAKFVRSNGGQVELLLRVKHGANPNFAFLRPDDRLFPYYRCVQQERKGRARLEVLCGCLLSVQGVMGRRYACCVLLSLCLPTFGMASSSIICGSARVHNSAPLAPRRGLVPLL